MPHEIRLAGPWEFSADDGLTWGRCILPFDVASLTEMSAGTVVRIRRKFHRPSGLEPSSVVSIVVMADRDVAEIALNDGGIAVNTVEHDAQLSSLVASHFKVGELLNEFNTLQISLAVEPRDTVSRIDSTRLRIVDD
ncbi:MAG: hypothetical protein ABGZ53_30485 [Fuerstiella sp.]|jgi:hypothetical protein